MTQRKLLTQNSRCVAQETNGGQRLALGVLFNHTALYLLSHSISQNPQLTHSVSLASQGVPRVPCLFHPSAGIKGGHTHSQRFMRVVGLQTLVLSDAQQ